VNEHQIKKYNVGRAVCISYVKKDTHHTYALVRLWFLLFLFFFGCVVAVYMNSFVRSHMKQWWNIYIIDYGM